MEPKEYDNRKSHISSKFRMIYISSNNGRHPVTKNFTPLHYTSLHVCMCVCVNAPCLSID